LHNAQGMLFSLSPCYPLVDPFLHSRKRQSFIKMDGESDSQEGGQIWKEREREGGREGEGLGSREVSR